MEYRLIGEAAQESNIERNQNITYETQPGSILDISKKFVDAVEALNKKAATDEQLQDLLKGSEHIINQAVIMLQRIIHPTRATQQQLNTEPFISEILQERVNLEAREKEQQTLQNLGELQEGGEEEERLNAHKVSTRFTV